MSWIDGPMAGFDLETTSADPETARVVTASVVVHLADSRVEHSVDAGWIVDPGIEIPDEAAKIHGFTTERARAEGADPVIALDEIAVHLEMVFAQGIPLVIYNAPYDLTVMDRETRRHGLRPFGDLLDGVTAIIDPLVLDKHSDPYRKGSRKLTAACEHYKVTIDTAHEARSDVLAAMRVAWRIGQKRPHLAAMSFGELFALQCASKKLQAASLQDYFKRTGKDIVVDDSWPWKPKER